MNNNQPRRHKDEATKAIALPVEDRLKIIAELLIEIADEIEQEEAYAATS